LPYCVQAKNLLKQKGVAFEEINIEETPSAREFIVAEGHSRQDLDSNTFKGFSL
jgi:glutaredoxin